MKHLHVAIYMYVIGVLEEVGVKIMQKKYLKKCNTEFQFS